MKILQRSRLWQFGAIVAIGAAALGGAAVWHGWLPRPWETAATKSPPPKAAHSHAEHGHEHGDEKHDDHDGHAHAGEEHANHEEGSTIELSANALKTIGYRPLVIELARFDRLMTLPAMVVERPGRSQIEITAPMTGVVTKIFPVRGEGVEPNSPMFELRLTHEELVAAQRDFLKTAESLDVVRKEIARLTAAGEQIVAGRRVLEQEYERQKLEGSLKAEKQALLLHGLSEAQVQDILESRELLQSLVVRAPAQLHEDESRHEAHEDEHLYHVQTLPIRLGQHVEAGEVLCVLADHCELLIEARAFEDDAAALREAAREKRDISAHVMEGDEQAAEVSGLKLLYLADSIDPETRAFKAYLQLPNEVALDQQDAGGRRFLEWRYKPGQRLELRVPVETWADRIVAPIGAVVSEGAESVVYRRHGSHFDRVAVHVEHRDQTSAVIASDGSLRAGDTIAAKGAYQIHQALKMQAGGGVDPHAGHNH